MSILLAFFNIICCTFVILLICLFVVASIKCFISATAIKDTIFFLLFAIFTSWTIFLIHVYIMNPAWMVVFAYFI